MYWPDTQTGVDVEPARKPVASAVRKYFTEGGAGTPPTVPGGDWFNQFTNEMLNVLAAAGIDPSKTDDSQLLLAVQSLSNASIATEALRRHYFEAGYDIVGTFKDGFTYVKPNDIGIDEATGKGYVGPVGDIEPGTDPTIGPFTDVSDVTFGGILRDSALAQAGLPSVVTESSDNPATLRAIITAANRGMLPVNFLSKWDQPMVAGHVPQALAESENYFFITEDEGVGGAYSSRVFRIHKETGVKSAGSPLVGSHGQGIGVVNDDEVFIGGSTNGTIYTYNFSTLSGGETACVGLFKDFPFCFDHETNRIYQLQDLNGTSGFITRLAILDKDSGFIGDTSIPLEVVKGGYPQAISYSGGQLFIASGGAWSNATGGSWNGYWVLYKVSIGGILLDSMKYLRSSMGLPLDLPSLTQHEPQGIFVRNGKISLLQLLDSGLGVFSNICQEDLSGVAVRSIPRNSFHIYNGLDDIGINIASLPIGGAIKAISDGMSDGTSVTFILSNEPWASADLGIPFGVCQVTKINRFRVCAQAFESSSSLTASTTPKSSIVSVYDTIQSKPRVLQGESNVLSAGYTGPGAVAIPGSIVVSNSLLVGQFIFHISSSPLGSSTVFKFSRGELDAYIGSGIQVVLFSGGNSLTVTFSSTGFNILSVSGSPYIRYVFTN